MSAFKKNHSTPKGILLWSYLFETDSGGKYSDDKYKTTYRLYGDEAQELIKKIDSFIPEAQEAEETDEEFTMLPYRQALDKEKNVIEGAFDFTFKTKNKPMVIDSKKNRIQKSQIPGYKNGMAIGEGVVQFKPHHFSIVDRKTKQKDFGIGLYLQAVMITGLNSGGVDMNMFEDYDDGFVISGSDDVAEGGEEGDEIPDFASK